MIILIIICDRPENTLPIHIMVSISFCVCYTTFVNSYIGLLKPGHIFCVTTILQLLNEIHYMYMCVSDYDNNNVQCVILYIMRSHHDTYDLHKHFISSYVPLCVGNIKALSCGI